MAIITTYLNFVANITIPNSAPSLAEGANLDKLINQFEPKMLKDIFGYKMYDDMQTNYTQGSGAWHDLIAGATYIDSSNNTQYWDGFRTVGLNPIANYIYCKWHEQNVTNTVSLGERKGNFENMEQAALHSKYIKAWNEMVDMLIVMDEFITINKDDYTNYIGLTFFIDGNYNNFNRLPSNIRYFKKINGMI